MNLKVFVKIGRRYEILSWNGNELTVGINTQPTDGAANIKLVEILSKHLGVSKSTITIIKGSASRHKMLKVDIDSESFNSFVAKLVQNR